MHNYIICNVYHIATFDTTIILFAASNINYYGLCCGIYNATLNMHKIQGYSIQDSKFVWETIVDNAAIGVDVSPVQMMHTKLPAVYIFFNMMSQTRYYT